MRSAFVVAGLVASWSWAALAPAAVAAPDRSEQWCPGQPWSMAWGVNWDGARCHAVAKPNDANADLHPTPAPDPGPPSDYPPGRYPPNYNWGEHYPYNTSPYGDSRQWGRHN